MSMFSGFDIRGRFGETLTVEYAWNVGKALADWLPEDGRVVVVSKASARPEIIKAVIEGLRLQGRDVLDGGQGDKQTVIQISAGSQTAGAVMISHDELEGLETIELYQENAAPVTSETGLAQIASLVEAGNFVPAAVKGELTSII